MQEDEPGDQPTHAKAPALRYREILADDGDVTLIEVSEWTFWLSSLERLRDQASDITPWWIAAGATPGTGRPSHTAADASPTTNTPETP